MPVSPWDSDSLAHVLTAPVVQPVWRVDLPGRSITGAPAWDVQVTLNGGASPYGTASFKLPLEAPYLHADLNPYTGGAAGGWSGAPVKIHAGYQRAGGPDLRLLFLGFITSRKVRRAAGGEQWVEFKAETAEALYDYPSHRTYSVSSSYTELKEIIWAMEGSSNPWYRIPYLEDGGVTAPSSAELTAFRNLSVEVGDNVGDFLRTCAAALGQWARGNARGIASGEYQPNTATWIVTDDPYPYTSATALTLSAFTELDRVEDVNGWANILDLSCSWTNSSNDTLTKRRTYLGAGVSAGTGQVRAKGVSLNAYPPAGSMPASWATAAAWVRRIGPMQEVKYTGTGRAMFWLQPRIDAIDLTDNGMGDTAGAIDSITFLVDQGLQTLTWSADSSAI